MSEKEIALQLPESTQYQIKKVAAIAHQSFEAPLMVRKTAPPNLNVTSSAPLPVSSMTMLATQAVTSKDVVAVKPNTVTTQQNTVKNQPKVSNTMLSADPLAKQYAQSPTQKVAEPKKVNSPAQQAATKVKAEASPAAQKPALHQNATAMAAPTTKHVVQSNESLWAIASRVATEQNRPIGEVMKQIKSNNQHAFIQGDINRLRRGVALNLNTGNPQKEEQKLSVANVTNPSSKQSGKAKYRLNQAELSLVAEKEQDSASGSAKKNTERNQTSNELSLKVMTSRKKTVKLQRNVTQLELALRHKDHRIQLLNTRLAQLQQQLKAQQVEKKPTH